MGYSQNNESEIIDKYFSEHAGSTFLSIGENDGITLSNVYALTLKGWNGTCIEPSPEAYRRLETNYLGLPHTLINAAVTDFNGEITLHQSGEHLGNGDVSLLSTIIPEEKKRWVKESWTDIKVPAINFGTLLGISKVKQFDLISIDVEGAELTILKQMDLKALGCKMLIAEFNGQRQAEFDAIVLPQGYKLIHKNGENLIYTVI
jgi:FkbM family methyltransferase